MKKLLKAIGRALVGMINHNALVFLFFLVVSAIFWLLQTLNETFEVEVTIPVRLENIPENVLITTEPPSEITAIVQDRGTTLVRYWRRKEFKPLLLDFNEFDNGLVTSRVQVPQSVIKRSVESLLEGTSHLLSLRPDTIEYYYNRGLRYRLPVKVCGTFTASPQNYILDLETDPDSVDVYAPTAILDTMRAAYTKALTFTDLTTTTTKKTRLVPIRGVKYEPDEVNVTAQVDFYTEKTLEVPIIGLNFPADKVLRTFPAKAQVTFRVGAAQFKNITPESFVLATTYEELLKNTSAKYHLHLKSLPPGISNVRISPQDVDYLIENVILKDDEAE